MSQIPSDLPPLPVVPLPVEPVYPGFPARTARPGAIGFIGITSIILASICLLAGIGFALMDVGFIISSTAAKTLAPLPPVVPPSASIATGASAERLPPDGLATLDRQTTADGLRRVRHLSDLQLLQLDELLTEHGKAVVPAVPSLTSQQLAASVSRNGHMAYGNTSGSDYFVLGDGRLELSDDRAVFFPTNGQPALRSNAIQLPANSFGASATVLTPDQIRSVLRTINSLNGTKIKNAQLNALIQTLQAPGQQVVVPTSDGSDPAWQVNTASTDANGTLTVGCNHGSTYSAINCSSNGTIGTSSVSSTGAARATMPTIDLKAATTTLSLTFVQFLLAIYLLIAGIMTLRGSARGRLLHWIYLAVKLPVAAATAAASVWMWSSLMQSVPSNGGSSPAVASFAGAFSMGVVPVALACLYPITLIFLLLSKSVRGYYQDPAGVTFAGR